MNHLTEAGRTRWNGFGQSREDAVPRRCEARVAAVTGGSRGIGRAIAEAMLAEGASIAICGRSPDKGKAALEEMGAGDRGYFVACDVRQRDEVEEFIDATAAHFGALDILVNNAGGTDGFARVHELTDQAWDNALAWNLNSTFWATRRALPHMLRSRWGRIIAISSVEGKQATKSAVSHYITNKHAINGFVKAVAYEYGPDGITSNAICPGAIETDTMRDAGAAAASAAGISYQTFLDRYAEESMIKRLIAAEEVAAMAVLLASDAGAGITGALLNVDGGSSSW
jgi:3-hydroxybutyrate dehydrogenase/3-oxoacyl-[acyl-carrier protein] reductase